MDFPSSKTINYNMEERIFLEEIRAEIKLLTLLFPQEMLSQTKV